MLWIDWVIVIVILLSVMGGLSQGFFRAVCSAEAAGQERAGCGRYWVPGSRTGSDGGGGDHWIDFVEDAAQHRAWMPGQDSRRRFRVLSRRAAGDAGDTCYGGILPTGTLAGGGKAAAALFCSMPPEHPHEPDPVSRAGEGGIEDFGRRDAVVASS